MTIFEQIHSAQKAQTTEQAIAILAAAYAEAKAQIEALEALQRLAREEAADILDELNTTSVDAGDFIVERVAAGEQVLYNAAKVDAIAAENPVVAAALDGTRRVSTRKSHIRFSARKVEAI